MRTSSSILRRGAATAVLALVLLAGHSISWKATGADAPAKANVAYADAVRPFLATHCFACHGEKVAKGKLRLDTLSGDLADLKTVAIWATVHDRLQDGDMPPKGRPRPAVADKQAVFQWYATALAAAAPPRGSLCRRLNRAEYENTLADLFGVPGLQIKEHLPPDGEIQGFDTVGDALDISYVQMGRYLEAAESVFDQIVPAIVLPQKPAVVKTRFWPQDSYDWGVVRAGGGEVVPLAENGPHPLWNPKTGKVTSRTALGKMTERVKAMGTLAHTDPAGRLRFNGPTRLPASGIYRIRISAYSFDWDKGKVLPTEDIRPASLGTDTRNLGYFDALPNQPKVWETVAWLEPTDTLQFGAYSLPHGAGSGGAHRYKGPGVAVEWVECEGPLFETWPNPARKLLFGNLPVVEWKPQSKTLPPKRPVHAKIYTVHSKNPLADARRLIRDFAQRACRRPIPKAAVERYLQLVRSRLQARATFEDALLAAYKAILASPDFLFIRAEPGKRDPYALASRLSYFLWSSMPDEELMRHAADGSLLQRDVLRAQTERLLKDPKSKRFVENFTGQWLKLRTINDTQPDPILYRGPYLESDVLPYLVDSMVNETREFFATLIREDLSVTNVVHSDFALVNEPLAQLYGLQNVRGTALRKVQLPPGLRRGGLLTQASVLKLTANGTTTSPVKRGAWVATKLLGKEVPPPPPSVPGLDPDVRGATTIRQQLAKHRENQSCASCHARMDPFGFALENYDVIGAWRERYRFIENGRANLNGPQVDAAAETEDGQHFKDIGELKKILLNDPDLLARNLLKQLMVYAGGVQLGPQDRAEIAGRIDRLRKKNHGARSVLYEVVDWLAELDAPLPAKP